jgi:hypothetical protein
VAVVMHCSLGSGGSATSHRRLDRTELTPDHRCPLCVLRGNQRDLPIQLDTDVKFGIVALRDRGPGNRQVAADVLSGMSLSGGGDHAATSESRGGCPRGRTGNGRVRSSRHGGRLCGMAGPGLRCRTRRVHASLRLQHRRRTTSGKVQRLLPKTRRRLRRQPDSLAGRPSILLPPPDRSKVIRRGGIKVAPQAWVERRARPTGRPLYLK